MDLQYYVYFPLVAGLAYHVYKNKNTAKHADTAKSNLAKLDFLHQERLDQGLSPLQRAQVSVAVAMQDGVRDGQNLKIERHMNEVSGKFLSIFPYNDPKGIIV